MAGTIGMLVYVIISPLVFVYFVLKSIVSGIDRKQNVLFVLRTLSFFAITTLLAMFVIYGSTYQMVVDSARWQWGPNYSPFPITITGDLHPTLPIIPKSSFDYWKLLFLAVSLYFTLPQAVLRSANLRAEQKTGWVMLLGTLASLYGLGLGVISIMIGFATLTLIPSGLTVHFGNVLLMVISALLLFTIAGFDLGGLPNFVSTIMSFFEKPWLYFLQRVVKFLFYASSVVVGVILGVGIGSGIYLWGANINMALLHQVASRHTSPYIAPLVVAFLVGGLVLVGVILLARFVAGKVPAICQFMGITIVSSEELEAYLGASLKDQVADRRRRSLSLTLSHDEAKQQVQESKFLFAGLLVMGLYVFEQILYYISWSPSIWQAGIWTVAALIGSTIGAIVVGGIGGAIAKYDLALPFIIVVGGSFALVSRNPGGSWLVFLPFAVVGYGVERAITEYVAYRWETRLERAAQYLDKVGASAHESASLT